MPLKAIVIDDNRNDFEIISRLFRRYPEEIEVDYAENGKEALEKLGRDGYDIAFLDLRLPDINGIELLDKIVGSGERTPVIIITGQGDERAAVSAMKSGAYDYIVKDELDAELLVKTISHTLERNKLKEEKESLEKELLLYTNRLEDMVRERTAEIEYLNNYKELILSTLNDYIRVVDPRAKVIQYESQKIKETFGNSIGKPCYMFWKRETECENCVSIKAIEEGKVVEKEEESGDRKYHVTAIPLMNRDGSMSAIEVISNITDKKRLEEEIENNKRLAAMGELAAHVAHEIRNPLYILKMASGILAEECPSGNKVIKSMRNGIASLEGLANDILDFSRPSKLKLEMFDIKSLIDEIVEEMASTIGGSSIEIVKELPEGDIISWIDGIRFKSILKNLIANSIQAIKTTGRIGISVNTGDNDMIMMKVSDNGRGIPEDDLKKVFDPFFTSKAKGTGLGMCIVKRFVDMHGGDIEIWSEVGKGTEVIINIPMKKECPYSV